LAEGYTTRGSEGAEMSNVLVAVSLEETIAELAEVRARKAELAERESEIRSLVLDTVAKQPTQILNGKGDLIAEITLSERRSINSWDDFETKFPEAYEALVKFGEVLTLNLPKEQKLKDTSPSGGVFFFYLRHSSGAAPVDPVVIFCYKTVIKIVLLMSVPCVRLDL
jgi:hypothetical protein